MILTEVRLCLEEGVNCTKLDTVHDHRSQDCPGNEDTSLIEPIAQALPVRIDLTLKVPFISLTDRENFDQSLLKKRKDDQGEDGLKQHLDTVNRNVIVFLIK